MGSQLVCSLLGKSTSPTVKSSWAFICPVNLGMPIIYPIGASRGSQVHETL